MQVPQRITVKPVKCRRLTEMTEAEALEDVLVEYEYIVVNPDWFREGDEPEVQLFAVHLGYNAFGCESQEVSTRFFPGTVVQKIEAEIAARLVREAA
jgi:hypothetical protein